MFIVIKHELCDVSLLATHYYRTSISKIIFQHGLANLLKTIPSISPFLNFPQFLPHIYRSFHPSIAKPPCQCERLKCTVSLIETVRCRRAEIGIHEARGYELKTFCLILPLHYLSVILLRAPKFLAL